MRFVRYLFLICSVSCLAASIFFFVLHSTFKSSRSTAQTIARAVKKKSKKDVPVYGHRHPGVGPIHQVMTIRDQTSGTYIYEVDGRRYKKRYKAQVTSKQMPDRVTVCYLRSCPRICYVASDVMGPKFWIYGFACLAVDLVFWMAYLQILFKG